MGSEMCIRDRVTHNNESALTIVVPLSPRYPLDVKTSLHDMRTMFERFVQTKEETKLFIIAKKKETNKQTVTSVPKKYKCSVTRQSAV